MTRILVVEDEESFSEALSYLLGKEGFDVAVAGIVLPIVPPPPFGKVEPPSQLPP